MKKVICICGSLRGESSNMGILLALKELSSSRLDVEIFKGLDKFPHFNPDLTETDIVLKFKNKLKEADALVISTPEYAHGIPGCLKNALDWVVRDESFPGMKVGLIIGATGDGIYVKESLGEVLRTMSAELKDQNIINVSGVQNKVKHNGVVLDNDLTNLLKNFTKVLLK